MGANALPAMPTLTAAATVAAATAASRTALREPRAMQVTARGELISFESRLSDGEAQDLLQYCAGSFARSLWQQSYSRGLSPAQLAWAHKLATDLIAQESPSDSDDDDKEPQFSGLFKPFMAARAKGARRLTMRFSDAILKLNKSGDAIWVLSSTDKVEGDYGLQPKYLGKVTPSRMDSRIPDSVKETLVAAAADPLSAAIRYGRETGFCSCCGRELTNKESIKLGIGPICREKFGM